jgi:glycosyltransferase involved in cell wall biosynthesis
VETLQSVAAQTFPEDRLELIVVDDGSTDGSIAAAREFLAATGRTGRVVALASNRGPSAARNVGWRAAKGDWIQFLDSDDLLTPEKIAMQADLAGEASAGVAVVYSPWQHLTLHEGSWRPNGPVLSESVETDTVLRIIATDWGYVGPVLIRRRYLEAVSGFNEAYRYAEDQDLLLRIAMAGGEFRGTRASGPAFYQRQRPDSLGYESPPDLALHRFKNIVMAEAFLRSRCGGTLPAETRRQLAAASSGVLQALLHADREAFRDCLEWTLELDPSFLPVGRPRARMVARLVGYARTEEIVSLYHSLKRLCANAFRRLG